MCLYLRESRHRCQLDEHVLLQRSLDSEPLRGQNFVLLTETGRLQEVLLPHLFQVVLTGDYQHRNFAFRKVFLHKNEQVMQMLFFHFALHTMYILAMYSKDFSLPMSYTRQATSHCTSWGISGSDTLRTLMSLSTIIFSWPQTCTTLTVQLGVPVFSRSTFLP